jgi:hypothetical protein
MFHGSGKHVKDVVSGIQGPVSDSRTFCHCFFPLRQRSHPAEPERIGPALERPDRINPAALMVEAAPAVSFLGNAETRSHRPQMRPDQIGCGRFEKIGQGLNLTAADADDAGISCAAGAAAQAFKTNSGFKKIPAVKWFVGVAIHRGFDL